MSHPERNLRRAALAGVAMIALTGCEMPFDFDLRGDIGGGFDTSEAARNATAPRPQPDNRGVISYPNYQVVVARRGDTVADVATRLGTDANELARFNGVKTTDTLRNGEILALPNRVAEPSPATGAIGTGPIQPADSVDIETLASGAIDRSGASSPVETSALPSAQPKLRVQTGREPVRHKVERGETAYTIARLYQVSVRSLAEWNGLGPDFAIREGQYLLIPVAREETRTVTAAPTSAPGQGSDTPTPPSATQPLPRDEDVAAAAPPPAPDIGQSTASNARMSYPVKGKIIRPYAKGKNEGIDISAAPGTEVSAAASGKVAAITSDADQVPIIVIKHPDNVLTVYANVDQIVVSKGDSISRGQKLGVIRPAPASYVHFEVREGFDSVDPMPYLR